MKLVIAGSRGIPASYGGFETFAEEIAIRLQEKGIAVTVICQDSDQRPEKMNNVRLLYSKYKKAINPIRFYHDSLQVIPKDTDVLLVCGVGGSVFYPFLNRKKYKLLTHVDGREELRGKYSALKKLYVKIAQSIASRFSDHIIADSFAIRKFWLEYFKLQENKVSAIEFGANIPGQSGEPDLKNWGLVKGGYFMVVCRMVPENNLEIILKGFSKSRSNMKLVLVGDTSGEFGISLKRFSSEQVVFLESVYNRQSLISLRRGCFAYIHGHSVGGTNPSLLEAMAAGNICICHDNEFNRETTENKLFYFNSEQGLADQISLVTKLSEPERKSYAEIANARISDYYNWERIANEYMNLFSRI